MSVTVEVPLPVIPGLAPGPEHQTPSLGEVHATVSVSRSPQYWRRLLGFLGPGFLISVGYMDPGNWATDIAGGSRFGYTLLFVIMASNLMAVLLQSLSLKLGVATERDLAQLCHQSYGPRVSFALWVGAEIAIAACDLAEVIGAGLTRQIVPSLQAATAALEQVAEKNLTVTVEVRSGDEIGRLPASFGPTRRADAAASRPG